MSDKTQNSGAEVKTMPTREAKQQILRGDCNSMQHAHNVWACRVDKRMTKEELEKPSLWALVVAKGFKVGDRVEITTKNLSQISKGIVTFVRGNDARVSIYAQYDLHEQEANEINVEGFKVKFVSNEDQWCIFDGTTGNLIKKNQPTDQAAIKYVRDHMKALGIA